MNIAALSACAFLIVSCADSDPSSGRAEPTTSLVAGAVAPEDEATAETPGLLRPATGAAFGSAEYLNLIVECIEESGFDATADLDLGVIEWDRPRGQEALSDQVASNCERDLLAAGRIAEASPMSDAELRQWYEAYEITNECLDNNGYPTKPLPSLETFLGGGGTGWHPYDAIMRPEGGGPPILAADPEGFDAAWDRLEQTCPQDYRVVLGLDE